MATKSISAIATAFQLKYQYRIAGERDNIFSALGPLIKEDTFQTSLLKSQRTRYVTTIKAIDASTTLAENQKLKQKGETTIESLSAATRRLRTIARDPDAAHKQVASAAGAILRDLRDATDQYAEGRATLTDADYSADDEAFFRDLQAQVTALKSIVSRQKTYLRQENVIFSTDINSALKSIKAIEATIASFAPPAVGSTPVTEGEAATSPETTTATTTEGDGTTTPPETVDIVV